MMKCICGKKLLKKDKKRGTPQWCGFCSDECLLNNKIGLERTAFEAAFWYNREYERRTALIESGESTNPYWMLEEERVSWTEVKREFSELASVDGWYAVHNAMVLLGLKKG